MDPHERCVRWCRRCGLGAARPEPADSSSARLRQWRPSASKHPRRPSRREFDRPKAAALKNDFAVRLSLSRKPAVQVYRYHGGLTADVQLARYESTEPALVHAPLKVCANATAGLQEAYGRDHSRRITSFL